jgi:hypothetical protein
VAVSFTDTNPWGYKAAEGPDVEVGGWYINLGITGARAKLTNANLRSLTITYIFKNTPAYGKLQIGDLVVGVNNRAFVTPHINGYGMDKFGGEGPLMDFGNALEESQSLLGGQLTLSVLRGNQNLTIILNIGTRYGAFTDSYPFNCPKTNLILSELYPYIANAQRNDGGWNQIEFNCFAGLALLASGDK